MIRLYHPNLSEEHAKNLASWQDEVNAMPSFEEQIEAAKRLFSNKNQRGNDTFDEVKTKLTTMCSGARRCCYCEDSCADEVEHIFPKTLFPEKVFAWKNYLYACGTCNGPKNNKFAIFDSDGKERDITPKKNAPHTKPPTDDALLIDPTRENPEHFYTLDLQDTRAFVVRKNRLTPLEQRRAEYTKEFLNLNRDVLTQARSEAFEQYKSHLVRYEKEHSERASSDTLQRLETTIASSHHPSVWSAMKAQRSLFADINAFFTKFPQALTW